MVYGYKCVCLLERLSLLMAGGGTSRLYIMCLRFVGISRSGGKGIMKVFIEDVIYMKPNTQLTYTQNK